MASRVLMVSLVLYLSRVWTGRAQSRYAPCDSPIYCYGDLLDAVQREEIFSDSKEFVDRPLTGNVSRVLAAFSNLPANASAAELREFVLNWTLDAGSDIEPWTPGDWVQRPPFIDMIENKDYQQWAVELNGIWKQLGRQESADVSQFPQRHSLISVPHPFIVPGGRFREFYYWDSYWIVRGLLLCNMTETAKNMILNMVSLVERYGFVPNGGRVYYSHRSQPPLLTQMVDAYLTNTGDVDFLQSVLPALFTEYEFWIENRTVDYVTDQVVRYGAELDVPRPESYREDIATATNSSDKGLLYSHLASGAESGWDFSSRWLASDSLSSIRTLGILPADLNAILCQNEATLARFYRRIGNDSMADHFEIALRLRQASFDKLFWNETLGIWKDMDVDQMGHLDGFYASSLVPLLWNCTSPNASSNAVRLDQQRRVYYFMKTEALLDYVGGIPTSLNKISSQQWDFPNAWAPLQWFPVLAWYNSSDEELREAASFIASTWLKSTYDGWLKYNMTMFEKYDCTESGEPGRGGEYVTQAGFGWTNAVVLDFLSLYLDATPSFDNNSSIFPFSTTPALSSLSPATTQINPGSSPTPMDILPSPSSTIHSFSLSPTSSPVPNSSPQGRSLGWVAVIVLLVVAIVVTIPCVLCCRWCYVAGETRYWARVRNEHLIAAGGGGGGGGGGGTRGRDREHYSPMVYSNEYADDSSVTSWDV